MTWTHAISLTFMAGALGGIANGLAIWLFGTLGINQFLNVKISPPLTLPYLYSKITWGGIWGLMFLMIFQEDSPFLKAALLSLAPTLVQLFFVFPTADKGIAGLKLGVLTPIMVIFFNLIWAFVAVMWISNMNLFS